MYVTSVRVFIDESTSGLHTRRRESEMTQARVACWRARAKRNVRFSLSACARCSGGGEERTELGNLLGHVPDVIGLHHRPQRAARRTVSKQPAADLPGRRPKLGLWL